MCWISVETFFIRGLNLVRILLKCVTKSVFDMLLYMLPPSDMLDKPWTMLGAITLLEPLDRQVTEGITWCVVLQTELCKYSSSRGSLWHEKRRNNPSTKVKPQIGEKELLEKNIQKISNSLQVYPPCTVKFLIISTNQLAQRGLLAKGRRSAVWMTGYNILFNLGQCPVCCPITTSWKQFWRNSCSSPTP